MVEPVSTSSNQQRRKISEKYEHLRLIESGFYADLYRGKYRGSKKLYLIKTLKKATKENYDLFVKEINKLVALKVHKSPYILSIFEFDWDPETYTAYYTMPNYVSLSFMIMTNSAAWTPQLVQAQAFKVLQDISNALTVLQNEEQIAHNYINIQNIFYNSKTDHYLLGNLYGSTYFSKAKDTSDLISMTTSNIKTVKQACAVSPSYFISPEVIDAADNGTNKPEKFFFSDIFSLGFVVVELIGGINDYHRTLNLVQNAEDYKKVQTEIWQVLKGRLASEPLVDLLCKMLNKEPDQRPSPKDIIAEVELLASLETTDLQFAEMVQRKKSSNKKVYAEAPPGTDYKFVDEIPAHYYPSEELKSIMQMYFATFRPTDLDLTTKDYPILGPLELKSDGAIYLAQFYQGKPHGRGERFASDSYFVGNFNSGKMEPKGVYINYAEKKVYSGQFLDGKLFGIGEMVSANGIYYKGDFTSNKRVGQGFLKFSDISSYNGEFFNDKFHGKGEIIYRDGSSYTGSFRVGKRHGFGELVYANGYVYQGNWEKGQFHGQGKLIVGSGAAYQGNWVNGSKHGDGVLTAGDTTFRGTWKSNVAEGKGWLLFKIGNFDEVRVECTISNGLVSGNITMLIAGTRVYEGKCSAGRLEGNLSLEKLNFKNSELNQKRHELREKLSKMVYSVPYLPNPDIILDPEQY